MEVLSDDDFIPQKRTIKQSIHHSSSEDEICTQNETAEVLITELLPKNYHYKFIEIFEQTTQAHITVSLHFSCNQRKMQGNGLPITIIKETMVYELSKRQNEKRVVKKLYLPCHHNQRQTGKHTKCKHFKNYT